MKYKFEARHARLPDLHEREDVYLELDDVRLRRLCAHLHELGPRSVYEFIREIRAGGDVVDRLEVYGRLDAGILIYLGADRLTVAEARQ